MPTNINLLTILTFGGSVNNPAVITNQNVPDCTNGYSVVNVLVDTTTGLEVTTTNANTIGAIKITNKCTNDFTIVQGSRYAIMSHIDNNCCITLGTSATLVNLVNTPGADEPCVDGAFVFPVNADMTPYGGGAVETIADEAALIARLLVLTTFEVKVVSCAFYFPINYTGVVSDIEVSAPPVPPVVTLTNINTGDTEYEFTDTHGSEDGINCTTWIQEYTEYSIDGGTTFSPQETGLTSPVELCGKDISVLLTANSYDGDLTVHRFLEDCGGTHEVTFTIPITTDINGVIDSANGNGCFMPLVQIQAFDSNVDSPANSVDNNDIVTTFTTATTAVIDVNDAASWTFTNGAVTCGGININLGPNFVTDFVANYATCLASVGLTKPNGTNIDATNVTITNNVISFIGMAKNLPANGSNSAIPGTAWEGSGIPDNTINNQITVAVVFNDANSTVVPTDSDVVEQGLFLEWILGAATNANLGGLNHGFEVGSNVFPQANNSVTVAGTLDSVPANMTYLNNAVQTFRKVESYYFNPNAFPTTDYCTTYDTTYTLPYSNQNVAITHNAVHRLSNADMSQLRAIILDEGFSDDPYQIYLNLVLDNALPSNYDNIVMKLDGTNILTFPNSTNPINTGLGTSTLQNLTTLAKNVVHEITLEADASNIDGTAATCAAYSEIKFVVTDR